MKKLAKNFPNKNEKIAQKLNTHLAKDSTSSH